MFEIKEIHADKSKVNIELENGNRLSGYVLKMDIKNNFMVFLQDESIDSIKFPLNSVIRVEEIQKKIQ